MQWLTISVALAGGCAVLWLNPARALLLYFVVLLLYPPYLVFGEAVYFSAQRVVGVTLLARLVMSPRVTRGFRWCRLDGVVAIYMILNIITLVMSTEVGTALRNRGGFVTDTFVPYLLVRLVVVSRAEFAVLLNGFAMLLVPLGLLGTVEAVTGWNAFGPLLAHCPWYSVDEYQHLVRFGYFRAIGPTAQPIIFGLVFSTLLPLVLLWRFQSRAGRRLWWFVAAVAVLGVISSISSTPLFGMLVGLGLVGMRRYKRYIKLLAGVTLLGCLGVEMASNRHFYTVLAEAVGFDTANSWYRARLIDAAVRFLPEYWVYGYGFGDWGWGMWMGNSPRMDACNEYVLQVGRHGLFAFAAFLYMLGMGFMSVRWAYVSAADRYGRACTWAVGSSLAGLMAVFFATSLFSTMLPIFYCVLALCAAGHWKGVHPHASTDRPRPGSVLRVVRWVTDGPVDVRLSRDVCLQRDAQHVLGTPGQAACSLQCPPT